MLLRSWKKISSLLIHFILFFNNDNIYQCLGLKININKNTNQMCPVILLNP